MTDTQKSELDELARDVGARCVAMRVHRASRRLTRRYDDAVRAAGITITQFTLLNTIAVQKPESISDISDVLDIDRTTLSRSLGLLEKDGLVRLGEPGPDRRRGVALTEEGERVLAEAYESWKRAQSQVEALVEADDLAELDRILSKLRT